MLHNHWWEKQPKGSGRQKNAPKEILLLGQKVYLNVQGVPEVAHHVLILNFFHLQI